MDENMVREVLRVAETVRKNGWFYTTQLSFDPETFAACGLEGYVSLDPWFERAGLRLRPFRMDPDGISTMPTFGPKGDEWIGRDALMQLMDLTWDQATFMFGCIEEIRVLDSIAGDIAYCNDIRQCIRRINRVLKGEFDGA